MANKKTYRIVAFMLSLLMFCTSVGFTIDMHFCQGKLAAVSVFGEASCCKTACTSTKKACCQLPKTKHTDDNCCDNTSIDVQLDTNIPKAEATSYSQIQLQFVASFITAYFSLPITNTSIVQYQNYKPPLLIRDVLVLIQTFLC